MTFGLILAVLAALFEGIGPSPVIAAAAEAFQPPAPAAARQAKPEPGQQPPEAMSLEKLITALRVEEAKYRDIDYSIRRTTRKVDPTNAAEGSNEVSSQETRRVVLQGDWTWFRGESTHRVFKTEQHREEFSAYDGERTRSVIVGNGANIHLGRFEHPDVFPAHSLTLMHYRVNFPLSIYLRGDHAIHALPKYPRFMQETGSVNEFTKVAAALEGEEDVDGLHCIKVRVNRWYYSNSAPALQYLWLAPERNYLCVKERVSPPNSAPGDLPSHEMRVDDLRELAPGIWFPRKITLVDYDMAAPRQKKQRIASQTETVVYKVQINPRHDVAFFKDVVIPPGLPVFTIQDRKLVGSSLPEPIPDQATEKAKLAEVVAKVHEQERKFANLEVRAGVDYKHLGSDMMMQGIITGRTKAQRSVVNGALAYFTEHESYATLGGAHSEQHEVQAFDGQWARSSNRTVRDGQNERITASLRKGGGAKAEGRHDGIPVLRPHTFLLRDDWLYGPLADLLVSPWLDKINKYRLRFRYCGEADLDGHPCVKLRAEITTGEDRPPSSFRALWLATDRNYIPIKLEHYGGNFGLQPMPGGISLCEDFREIAPGLWYPFRSNQMSFDNWQDMARGRITLNWSRVYQVESATLSPKVDAALFHNVLVPAGTKVQVLDEERKHIGAYTQDEEGVAQITPAQYLELLAKSRVQKEKQKARQ